MTEGNTEKEWEACTAWELVFIGLELLLKLADCGGILVAENLDHSLSQLYFHVKVEWSTHSPISRLEAPEPLICILELVRR